MTVRRNPVTSDCCKWVACLITGLLLTALGQPVTGQEQAAAVPRITNSDTPANGSRTIELEEIWRAGGADDEETIFGIINRVLVDGAGDIYLLDTQLSEVKVFSPDGEPGEVLGREGDGPGEFRGPTDMAFLPDGTLGVVQAFPGKIVKLNLDNSAAGTWPLGDPAEGSFYIMRGLRVGGANIVAGGTQQHIDQAAGEVRRETFISSLGADGMRDKTYTASTFTMQFQDLRFDEATLIDGADRRFDVGPDGTVVVGIPRNGYEVSLFNPDGTPKLVFTREYEPWVRDERAAGIWQRIMEGIQAQQPGNAPISWEETEPDIEFVRVADDGNIWILNSRAMWAPPSGMFTYYDVFSADGEFLEQVNVVCPGQAQEDFLLFAGHDRAFMITGFWDAVLARFGGAGTGADDEEAEPMSVICYKVR